jgi:GNAT superfamily N-acetyltransferase
MNQSLTTTTETTQKIDGFSELTSESKTNNNIKMTTTNLTIGDITNKKHTLSAYLLARKLNFYPEQLYNFLFRDFSPDITSRIPEPILRQLRQQSNFNSYDKYDFQLRLLTIGTKLVGFAFWTCPKENNGKCCLEFLLIDEPYRSKGYGKILMDDFVQWADANRPHILIQIPSKDERCKHFYTKYGFKPKNPADTAELVNWERAV